MNPDIFKAKVIFVNEGNIFDTVVEFPFNINVKERLRLDGLNVPSYRSSSEEDKEIARKAKECAVRLLLQRNVLIEILNYSTGYTRYSANFFIKLDSSDIDTSYEQTIIEADGKKYIDVCKYMRMLCDSNYDVSLIDVPKSEDNRFSGFRRKENNSMVR